MQTKAQKRFCCLLAAVLLFVLCGCGTVAQQSAAAAQTDVSPAPLAVYCFDADKADAILLTTDACRARDRKTRSPHRDAL